jgi:hypothetical protein
MMSGTFKRLLAEGRLPEEPPVRVPAGPEQLAALEAIKAGIAEDLAGVELSKWDKVPTLRIDPRVPGHRDHGHGYGYRHVLRVSFAGDELQVAPAWGDGAVPCGGIDQLRRTLEVVRERLAGEVRRAQKSEKLKKLKQRAIETQIEALARRLGFSYAIEAMRSKTKLFVALDDQAAIAVDVPHGKYASVLAELPDLVAAVRAVHARGFRYSIVARDRLRPFREPRRA